MTALDAAKRLAMRHKGGIKGLALAMAFLLLGLAWQVFGAPMRVVRWWRRR